MRLIEPFYVRLSEALQARHMKAIELSRKTGIAKSMISRYQNGKSMPAQKNVALIAANLNVSPFWLIGNDVPMENYYRLKTLDEIDDKDGIGELNIKLFAAKLALIAIHGDHVVIVDNLPVACDSTCVANGICRRGKREIDCIKKSERWAYDTYKGDKDDH